jgi:hypothetical protein
MSSNTQITIVIDFESLVVSYAIRILPKLPEQASISQKVPHESGAFTCNQRHDIYSHASGILSLEGIFLYWDGHFMIHWIVKNEPIPGAAETESHQMGQKITGQAQ